MEAQIVMNQSGPVAKPFKDQRSSAARDLSRAGEQSKPELFRNLLQRALRAGLERTKRPLSARLRLGAFSGHPLSAAL